MQVREIGTVQCFFPEKGYGFVRRDGAADIFVHVSKLREGSLEVKLVPGVKVSFEIETTPRGLSAADVELL